VAADISSIQTQLEVLPLFKYLHLFCFAQNTGYLSLRIANNVILIICQHKELKTTLENSYFTLPKRSRLLVALYIFTELALYVTSNCRMGSRLRKLEQNWIFSHWYIVYMFCIVFSIINTIYYTCLPIYRLKYLCQN
jgi:hypothetical protein